MKTKAEIKALKREIKEIKESLGIKTKLPDDYTGWVIDSEYTECMAYCVDGIIKYGFDESGDWFEKSVLVNFSDLDRPATKEEVEQRLKAEAERREYNDGVKVKCLYDGTIETLSISFYNFCSDGWLWIDETTCIFKDGKWAEIIEESKSEPGWRKITQKGCKLKYGYTKDGESYSFGISKNGLIHPIDKNFNVLDEDELIESLNVYDIYLEEPKLNNIAVENLTRETGKEIIRLFQNLGFDTGDVSGNSCKSDGDKFIYYGVFNGEFDHISLSYCQENNIKIITLDQLRELAGEKEKTFPRMMWVRDYSDQSWEEREVICTSGNYAVAGHYSSGRPIIWSQFKEID